MKLTPGPAGKASITLKGQGSALKLPDVPLPLPLRVQLQAGNGESWESTYSEAGVIKNTPKQFNAKSD